MTETAICVVCGKEKPISRMRDGRHKVETGSHVTTSGGRRSGNSHSSSFGGSSKPRFGSRYSSGTSSRLSVKRDYAYVPGWACSYHGLLGRILTRLTMLGIIVWAGHAYLTGKFDHPASRATFGVTPTATDDDAQSKPGDDATSDEQASTVATTSRERRRASGSASHEPTGEPSSSAEQAAPALSDRAERRATAAAAMIADPGSNARIADAMTEAVSSGQPVRWHAGHLHGYAVPSAPDASGCRMIQVSVDETGDKSSAVKLCP